MRAYEAKAALRRSLNAVRARMTVDERRAASRAAVARLLDSGLLDGAKVVASFAAFRTELDPIDLEAADLELAYPRVAEPALRFFVTRHDALVPGAFGILEPQDGREVRPEKIDVFLVPGLAFTPDGRRLGYGGGYYDRVLGDARRAVGLAFDRQIVDDLPTEAHDVRVHAVVTDERVLRAGSPPR